MMEYKGYEGVAEFDSDAGVFCGQVIGIRDVITFEGVSVVELQQAFHDSIDDYIEFCESRGKCPEEPFSGRFVAQIPSDLHKKVSVAAERCGQTLNDWIAGVLAHAVRSSGPVVAPVPVAQNRHQRRSRAKGPRSSTSRSKPTKAKKLPT